MSMIGLIGILAICGGGLLVVVGVAVVYYLMTEREK
jgi:hypothetical protein